MDANVVMILTAEVLAAILHKDGWREWMTELIDAAQRLADQFVMDDLEKYGKSQFGFAIDLSDNLTWSIKFHVDGRTKCWSCAQNNHFDVAAYRWIERSKPQWWLREWPEQISIFTAYERPDGHVEGPYASKKDALKFLYSRQLSKESKVK